jgi:hypothetical protein
MERPCLVEHRSMGAGLALTVPDLHIAARAGWVLKASVADLLPPEIMGRPSMASASRSTAGSARTFTPISFVLGGVGRRIA